MQILYTLPNCPHCNDARERLNGEEYREVLVDNPLIELGMRAALGKVIAPVLMKDDGQLYFLVDTGGGEKKFVRLLA